VALARALINRPEVLLLDEPLGALDLKLRKEMQVELKTLQREVGITFVYVTHAQEEALTMSDRIAVMSLGKVLQMGTPTEIYERPNCRFVADLIGDSNFLEGVVQDQNGDLASVLVGDTLPVVAQTERTLSIGAPVTVAVRPEKIQLLPRPARGEHNSFPCQIEQVVYIGTETRFQVRLSSPVLMTVRQQNVLSTPGPTGFYADSDTPAYAVWLNGAGRVLAD
jgi:spermidine/putrescine transport system ATP-binding protein